MLRQNRDQSSKVLRPSNKSNGFFIAFFTAAEEPASAFALIQAGGPLVSSSGPPGACMTPSREINSSTLTFLMTESFRVLSDFVLIYGFATCRSVRPALHRTHERSQVLHRVVRTQTGEPCRFAPQIAGSASE